MMMMMMMIYGAHLVWSLTFLTCRSGSIFSDHSFHVPICYQSIWLFKLSHFDLSFQFVIFSWTSASLITLKLRYVSFFGQFRFFLFLHFELTFSWFFRIFFACLKDVAFVQLLSHFLSLFSSDPSDSSDSSDSSLCRCRWHHGSGTFHTARPSIFHMWNYRKWSIYLSIYIYTYHMFIVVYIRN